MTNSHITRTGYIVPVTNTEESNPGDFEKLCIFAPEFIDQMNAQKLIANDYISDACVGHGGCWQYGSTSAAVFGSAGRFSKSQPPRRVAFSAPSSLSQRATGSLLHTGKELDPLRLYLQSGELCRARLTSPTDLLTGYSYFGARYLDHELMTAWLSVDPMADKYPSISPYAYCAWNPIRLVDPEGQEIDDYFSYDGKYLGSDDARTDNVRIIDESLWNNISHDGMIEHSTGNDNSQLFSDAHSKMTEEAQLKVYQHYNPTKCKLFATSHHCCPLKISEYSLKLL